MWTKICGIKEVSTAQKIAELQTSAIGLNFFAKSVRSVDFETAQQIANAVHGQIELVGLFVNHPIETVIQYARELPLDWVQFHGDETIETLKEVATTLPNVKLMKAFRIGDSGLQELEHFLSECQQEEVQLTACLLDAAVKGEYGGTGKVAPWELIRSDYQTAHWPPLILAGGLTPDNVAAAIRAVQPWGVDLASGVESEPGVKDAAKIEQLMQEVESIT